MKKILLVVYCLLSAVCCFSQEIEMADELLRASGKIYVVVGVLVTILLGIILYMVMIDKKVSDIEKKINKK